VIVFNRVFIDFYGPQIPISPPLENVENRNVFHATFTKIFLVSENLTFFKANFTHFSLSQISISEKAHTFYCIDFESLN
jgi:hypothetical protein